MTLTNLIKKGTAWLRGRTIKLDAFLLEGLAYPEREHAITTMRAQALGAKHFAHYRSPLEAVVAAAPPVEPRLLRREELVIARVANPAEARFLYDEAVRRFPDMEVEAAFRVRYNTYSAATLLLGVGYVEVGEYKRAADVLQAGLRRQPDFAAFVSELSIALDCLVRTDEALALLDDWVVRRDGMDQASQRNVLISRGQLLLALGRPEEAEPMFVECLVLDPNDRLAAFELGRVASVRRGEPQEERVLTTGI